MEIASSPSTLQHSRPELRQTQRGSEALWTESYTPLKTNSLLLNMREISLLKAWHLCQIWVDFDRNCKRHILETKASSLPAFMTLLQSMGVPCSFKEKITRIVLCSFFFFLYYCKTVIPASPPPCSTPQPYFLSLLWLKFCSLEQLSGVESTSK